MNFLLISNVQNYNFNKDDLFLSENSFIKRPKKFSDENKENINLELDSSEKLSLQESFAVKNIISNSDSFKFEEVLEDEPTTPRGNDKIDLQFDEEPKTPTKNKGPKEVVSNDLATFSPEYSKIRFKNNNFVPEISQETLKLISVKNGELNYVLKNGTKKYPGQAIDAIKRLFEHCKGLKNPSPDGKIYKSKKGKFHFTASKEMIFTEGAVQPLEVGFLPALGIYKMKNGVKVTKTLNGYFSEKIWIAALKTQEKGYSIRSGGNGRRPKEKPLKRPAELILTDLTIEILKDKKKFNAYLAELRSR